MQWSAVMVASLGLLVAAPPSKPVRTKSHAAGSSTATRSAHKPVAGSKSKQQKTVANAKNGNNKTKPAVRRVSVRRLVHGRWVTVSRLVRVKPGPSIPPHPDADRLHQIQQAMADHGYFKGEVNGVWNADSVEALKRFQTDKNLAPDGKINALSLIGLGLGPKHDASAAMLPAVTKSDTAVPTPPPPQ